MSDVQQLFQQREKRIQDAVALKKPDRVPIACLWDFFPAKWKGVPGQGRYVRPSTHV